MSIRTTKINQELTLPQKTAIWFLNLVVKLILLIPHELRVNLFTKIIKFFCTLNPKYFKIAEINLKIAFPESTAKWRKEIFNASLKNLGLLLSDFLRIPTLSNEWIDTHILTENATRNLREFKIKNPDKGIVLVAGHFGSFELQGACLGFLGQPMVTVVRKIRPEWLNRWWNTRREFAGSTTIDREGAFKRALKILGKSGQVALLADQNVTRNHAVFVPWFGKLAATTKAVALLALRTKSGVFVSFLRRIDKDSYVLDVEQVDIEDLILKNDLSDQVLTEVTKRYVKIYEEHIRKNPADWFWIHRRWKTTPTPEEAEDLYN